MARNNKNKEYDMELMIGNNQHEEEATSPVIEETTEPITATGIICNSSFVNVRSTPSPTGEVISVLNIGDKVEILEKVQKFYKILFNKTEIGYIDLNFCKEG